jgi:hypothetical protein
MKSIEERLIEEYGEEEWNRLIERDRRRKEFWKSFWAVFIKIPPFLMSLASIITLILILTSR